MVIRWRSTLFRKVRASPQPSVQVRQRLVQNNTLALGGNRSAQVGTRSLRPPDKLAGLRSTVLAATAHGGARSGYRGCNCRP